MIVEQAWSQYVVRYSLSLRQSYLSAGTYRRYAFNGKETDDDVEFGDLTHYDYGFRIYNPALGRFLSVDPLTKSYPMLTPYQFASNSPITNIDLDGLEWLNSNEAMINITLGGVALKIENASNVVKNGIARNIVINNSHLIPSAILYNNEYLTEITNFIFQGEFNREFEPEVQSLINRAVFNIISTDPNVNFRNKETFKKVNPC